MERPFKIFLSALLKPRGAAAQLARDSGLTPGHISRMLDMDGLPERETFAKLITGMSQADRNALTIEYLKEHRPDLAADVQIIVADANAVRDRLTVACDSLDSTSREALATIIEGGSRAPGQLTAMLRSMAALFAPISEKEGAKPLFTSQSEDDLATNAACAPQTPTIPAPAATSSVIAPRPSRRLVTAKPAVPPIHQLPENHWKGVEKAAEETTPPPVESERRDVKYGKRRREA